MATTKISNSSQDVLSRQLIKNTAIFQSKTVDLITEISKNTKQMSELSTKVEKLVNLFEDAAKNVGETKTSDEHISSLAMKLENLIEQNKVIARGLLLLEEYVRGKTPSSSKQPSYQF